MLQVHWEQLFRSMVLSVDTKINEISDNLEMKVLGTSSVKRLESREAHNGSEMRQRRGKNENLDAVV